MIGQKLPQKSVVIMLVTLAIGCLLFTNTFAQTGTSSVRGTVLDAQGNAVAGATVTLISDEKNFSRTQSASESGGYVFSAVPPGTYRVEAEASGFKKAVINDVGARVDTAVDIDVQLETGNVSETVTVTAGSDAAINTTDATIGNTFESRRIEQLPLNARNIVGLLSLQTGVTRTGYVNGGRADQSNITLDGADVNEQQSGLDVVTNEAFASVLRVTPDSVQEFRVVTTNPNADQGRSSGAQVSLVTKSGTNNFHGSLYEYHRNTITTANDFFSNKAGVERPQLLRNIFGGSIGGPIIKDRAFFFFNYEGFREATGTSVVREVPLPTLGQGIVRYATASGASDPSCPPGTPAGVACLTTAEINAGYIAANGVSPGVNPAALAVLADASRRYVANDTTVGDGLNTSGFRFNARTPTEQNTYIAKFDFNLTDRQTFFVRGNYQNDLTTLANYGDSDCSGATDSIQCFPDTPPLTLWSHPKGLAIGHTWTASGNFVNRFTYGFTRAAFTQGGDSLENSTNFRFIYSPLSYTRSLSRTTPLHNFVNDASLIKGNHAIQLGGNVRLIQNNRTSFGSSFDDIVTNPSWYDLSGAVVTEDDNGDPIFADVDGGFQTDLRDSLTAVIGRLSQYSVDINYDQGGQILPSGTGITRSFATQEYELYTQDNWRIRPNFSLTYGLRWYTSTPVYERNGLQVKPTQSLGEYFERRKEGADAGTPLNDLITVDLAGKANNRPGFYEQDWNNFAPSVSFAWSPDLGDNFLGRLIGRENKSVIRGGFRMTYDRIGSQLAVSFDGNSTLGFKSSDTIGANTYNVTDRLAPLFTGVGQDVRGLPDLSFDSSLTFPLTTPGDQDQRIESSLDDTLTTPYNYSFNMSYGREIGKGLSFEASYVGRSARNLLATRDIMHLNNLRDPSSRQTWYEAINQLVDFRYADRAITSIQPIPFFENVLPGLAGTFDVLGTNVALTPTQSAYRRVAKRGVGGRNTTDYTTVQALWDDGLSPLGDNLFFHPQYAAFSTFSTIARSNYNSAQLSIRQRFGSEFNFDFNYTLAHSLDNASGLQNSTAYGTAFIVNALTPDDNYANSDFDARHIINANWLANLPFGRGKAFLSDTNKFVDAFLGGWQLTGIFRWNSGLPIATPFDAAQWATNWNAQSNGVRVRPLVTSPTRSGDPNIFSDPVAAFQSFRNARPGEVGDRNVLRAPGYISLDAGLSKTFNMPWEGHSIQFRWEVYNVTNTQRFDGNTIADLGLPQDPFLGQEPGADFGRFTATQTPLNENKAGRVMQFALRYQF